MSANVKSEDGRSAKPVLGDLATPTFNLSDDAVLIVGSQRSGTTLMRLILETHPAFRCFDESTAYEILAGVLTCPPDPRRSVFKIPRYTEQIDSIRWSDFGAPPAVIRYAGHPLVFLVRNPLDAVTSMLRLVEGQWFDTWIAAIIEGRAQRDAAFADRWENDRRRFASGSGLAQRAAVATLYWLYKNEALLRYQACRLPVHLVRYEELVSRPVTILEALLAALGEPWDDRVLEHADAVHTELMPDGLMVGGTDPTKPINDASVGSWKQFLDAEAEAAVRTVAVDLWSRISGERLL